MSATNGNGNGGMPWLKISAGLAAELGLADGELWMPAGVPQGVHPGPYRARIVPAAFLDNPWADQPRAAGYLPEPWRHGA